MGIEKLKLSLQNLLDAHIEKELPKVREEVKSMIRSTEFSIARLPQERPTVSATSLASGAVKRPDIGLRLLFHCC